MSFLKKAKLSNLTIIGSGLAGYTLVREIRKLDPQFPLKLITADNGDYYSKPQLSTALTHKKSPDQLVLISAEKFASQFNIELVKQTDLQELPEGPVVLATGASPVKLFPDAYHVNNLVDYQLFRQVLESYKKITIMGMGLVGCEFANDLVSSGYEVTMIAPDPYPLARLIPEPLGLALKKALENRGVKFASSYTNGLVLSAIGLKPNISLGKSFIKTNKGYIVDDYLQTSLPDVYALGDCMEYQNNLMPYIAPIAIGARALAKTLMGTPTPVIFPPMPIYIKTSIYPIVVLPPVIEEGEWKFEEKQDNIRGLFYNKTQKLRGFALGGQFTTEAMDWLKKLEV